MVVDRPGRREYHLLGIVVNRVLLALVVELSQTAKELRHGHGTDDRRDASGLRCRRDRCHAPSTGRSVRRAGGMRAGHDETPPAIPRGAALQIPCSWKSRMRRAARSRSRSGGHDSA
jgi:hypothetical protein